MRNSLSQNESPTVEELVREADTTAAALAIRLAASGENRFQGMPSGGDSRDGYRVLGESGLIGVHWPPELGGRGLTPFHTIAVEERLGYHWLPLSGYLLSVKTIGNALLRFAPSLAADLLP